MIDCGIVIASRLKSSRLKDKVLQQIGKSRAIEILLDHVINDKYPVVLAIPESKDDDILQEIAESKGVDVFRGYDDSPLHRITAAALENNFENVVRVTHDDILIDLTVLFNQIKHHIRGKHEYTYCRRIPEGCAAEVIKTSVLEDVCNEVGDKPIEFISYYIKNKYDTFEYYPELEYQFPFRLTMDYEEDLMLLRLLYASLPEPIGTLDIINFLKRHKYFTQINHLPAVTIYTCNYNTSEYVIETIKSILVQTMQDFELIIIDDCSTDDSMNIITEFISKLSRQDQLKIRLHRNEKNFGLPASCNKALEMGRGKYIVRVDSDDTIEPNMIEKMIEEIKMTDSQAVISSYHRIDENGNRYETITKNMWHPGCCLLSRWTANELKYRDGVQFMEGADFFERFKKKYKLTFYPEPLWNYRKRPGQKTQDINHPCNRGNK